jgi:hypothetical protein
MILPDYNAEELCQIFKNKCEEIGLTLEGDANQILMPYFENARRKPNFGNAGFTETFFGKVMLKRDRYLSRLPSDRQRQERKLIRISYIEEVIRSSQ